VSRTLWRTSCAAQKVAGCALLLVLAFASRAPGDDSESRGLVRIGPAAGIATSRHEAGGETRTVTTLDIGSGALRFDLGLTRRGRLEVSGAAQETGSVRLRTRVETPQELPAAVRDALSCEVSWNAGEPPQWRGCPIDLPMPLEHAQLVVEAIGQPGKMHIGVPELIAPDVDKKFVFVFLTDTLRADALSLYGADSMPGAAIERLARDSWVYTNARSTSGWTRPAIATLMTGARAATHGVYGRFDSLGESLPVLGEVMSNAGYRTIALSSNPNILERWGFGRGFDRFIDVGAANWTTVKTDAASLFDVLERELQTDSAPPTFFYVHLMDPHFPYQPEPVDRDALGDGSSLRDAFPRGSIRPDDRVWNEWLDYLAEIRGLDRRLGRFLAFLRTRGLYERSTIVIVGDHGEEFLDHGRQYHGQTLFDEMLRVPLLVKPSGAGSRGVRISSPVGLQDVAPTLVESLGLKSPDWPDGRAVLPGTPPDSRVQVAELRIDAISMASAIQNDWKLIVDHHGGSTSLYDLTSDPHEQSIVPADEKRTAALRELLRDEYSRGDPGWHFRACGSADPSSLRFTIEGAASPPDRVGFEASDNVNEADGAWDVNLQLVAGHGQRELQGKFVDVALPDVDEVAVAAGTAGSAALELRRAKDSPMAIAFGSSQSVANHDVVALSERESEATMKPGDMPVCGIVGDSAPSPTNQQPAYLRVWFVPASDEAPPPPDPKLDERLKALGYLQ
jgi:arylsulfatase A-like enzyme